MAEGDRGERPTIGPLARIDAAYRARKLRLVTHAYCCRLAHLLVDQRSRAALDALERYADELCGVEDLALHHAQAKEALDAIESGSREALLPPRPLRTGHAAFVASGSSIGQRAGRWGTRGWPHWPWGNLGVTQAVPATEMNFGGGCSTSKGHCGPADISASQPTPVG